MSLKQLFYKMIIEPFIYSKTHYICDVA